MTSQEYTKKLIESAKNSFSEHQATIFKSNVSENGGRAEYLVWRNPETSVGYIKFFKDHECLYVSGDYGHAIFRWYGGSINSLEWIADCETGYIHSKCEASEFGRRLVHWDPDFARLSITEDIKILEEDQDKNEGDLLDKFKEEGGFANIYSEFEWNRWCDHHAYEIFGDDWYEHIEPPGMTEHMRLHLMVQGLKAATKWIRENKPLEAKKAWG